MIDTIKIVSMINLETYKIIKENSIVKTSYHNGTGQIFYTIVNDKLEGTYNSSLSVRVGEGAKYKFIDMYYIEIEGSYHKIVKGYNSHNGYYNLVDIAYKLIKLVEKSYSIILPSIKHWFLQRVDIAVCYDLETQENIETYINNLSFNSFPRRNVNHYEGESIYLSGSTTTLKIYNKKKEFLKHDFSKFKNTNFNMVNYLNEIEGYIRFECEIKKRKLKNFFNKDYIRIDNVIYTDLKNIWRMEFEKFFKMVESDLKIVRNKEDVKNRLEKMFKKTRARNLYNFYLLIQVEGIQTIKKETNRSMYYKNISDLKIAKVDFSQKFTIDMEDNSVGFNPFECQEIL